MSRKPSTTRSRLDRPQAHPGDSPVLWPAIEAAYAATQRDGAKKGHGKRQQAPEVSLERPAAEFPLRLEFEADRRKESIEAEQRRVLHAIVAEGAARLGIIAPTTLAWIDQEILKVIDPKRREVIDPKRLLRLALIQRRMLKPGSPGRRSEREKNRNIAFQMHLEIIRLRAGGARERGILMKAAKNVRLRLVAKDPKSIPEPERLVKVYREHKAWLLENWTWIEGFL